MRLQNTGKKCCFQMKVIFFVQGKHSKLVKVKKCEQLRPAHFNEEIKHPRSKAFWAVVGLRFGGPEIGAPDDVIILSQP